MSVPALTKLTITDLRGAVGSFTLPFEKGKKLTVVYGENGTGKSTICDALEMLGKGKIGSLDNRGLGRTQAYWNTIGKSHADVAVTLEATGLSWRATIAKGNVVVQPPEERPRIEVLRRSQVLDLIEAQPGARYTAISRFIDVSGVERAEHVLRRQIASVNDALNLAVARIQENQESLQQFAAAAGQTASATLTWAASEAARDPHEADGEIAALRLLQATYSRLAEQPERLRAAEDEVSRANAAALGARQRAATALREITGGTTDVLDLLVAARAYVEAHPEVSACPLCGSADAAEDLAERISAQIRAFAAYQEAQATSAALDSAAGRAEQGLALLRERAQEEATAFEAARAAFRWSEDIALPAVPAPWAATTLCDWLAQTAELPAVWQLAEVDRQDRQQFLTTLRSALETYTENMLSHAELFALLPRLQRALEIAEEERKAFTDDLLLAIAGEVGQMYEAVHPGEGLNQISLALDATRRASLAIASSFGGVAGLPPQAYFSQAHLDTLGLCIFLALAKLDEPARTILVLDDVLGSVDEPHIDRLILMLYAETAKFRHCVMTTHYGPWKHKLRWGWLKNGQCQFIELTRWTPVSGIGLIGSVPDVARLRSLLAESPPDPQLVCAKAGVILEAALDFLTQLYQCSVPRKPDSRYTLGELLPAIGKKLRPLLRVDVRDGTDATGAPIYRSVSLTPILEGLTGVMYARNLVGCHFNAIALEHSDADALKFGQLVLELIEVLADPDAGWPRKEKAGTYWANAGETRRLFPLQQPS